MRMIVLYLYIVEAYSILDVYKECRNKNMTDTIDEKTIIENILRGDTEQYRHLVERYHRGLVQHTYNIFHDGAVAEDVAQDAFIQAYKKLALYNNSYAFSTWLYKITDNIAYRKLQQSKPTRDIDDIQETVADDAPSLDDQVDKATTKSIIRNAVAKLPVDYRQVVTYYYWDGYSYEQIAEITERPIGTIRTWLFRAKEQLRKELYGRI